MIDCTFENGNKANLRHVTAGVILLNTEKTHILLVKRAPFLSNPNKLGVPGGYVNRDETTSEAAARETLEETGYKAKIIALFRVNDNPNRPKEDRQNIEFIYLAQAEERVGKADSESTSVQWYDLNSLPPEEEFAFDHYENIQEYKDYLKNPGPLPLLYKRG